MSAQDRALDLARALVAEVKLVERGAPIIATRGPHGARDLVDEEIVVIIGGPDDGLCLEDIHRELDLVAVDLEPRLVEAREGGGEALRQRAGAEADRGVGDVLEDGAERGVLIEDRSAMGSLPVLQGDRTARADSPPPEGCGAIINTEGVNGVAVTPDGRFAVSAASDRTLKVWDLATGP